MTTLLLNAAVGYAARGWSVIPIRHQPNTPGKQPAWVEWTTFQTTRPDEATVRRMFRQTNLHGVGIILGAVSGGLGVRDFDDEASYFRWCEAQSTLATTLPTSKTARGFHVFFVNANPSATNATYEDGELKITRTYIVVPPSRHPSGAFYTWNLEPSETIPALDPYAVGLGQALDVTEQALTQSVTEQLDSICSACSVTTKASSPCSVSLVEVGEPVDDAIRRTLPIGPGQRNHRVFLFARELKRIPSLTDAPPSDLRAYVVDWWKRASPVIRTKEWATTWEDFIIAWGRVKYLKGDSPVETIMSEVSQATLPAEILGYTDEQTKRLLLLCRRLQENTKGEPFYLTSRTAAEVCGFETHLSAWRRMTMLEGERILEVAKRGSARTATRYRFRG